MEALSGDAALMHLLGQIDQGIRVRKARITSGKGRLFRLWYRYLKPLRWIMLIWYALQSFYEKPAWCIGKIEDIKNK